MKKIIHALQERWQFYLLEVVVITFGVLLAFILSASYQNWNEGRKAKLLEKKLLADINLSIQGNIWQLEVSINGSRRHIASAEIILSHFQNNLAYHDSLRSHFRSASAWNEPTIRNIGYESLKNYGLNTIKNDSIRKELNIYEAGWLEILNNRQSEYHYNTAAPILTDLFECIEDADCMKPNDYEALKNSKKYATVLRTSIGHRKTQIWYYSEWLKNLENLETMIAIELKE